MSALSGHSERAWVRDESNRSNDARLLGSAERLAGLVLLAATAPVIIVSAVALACTYRSFPLIAHRRIGRNSVPFWMLKLRTMRPQPGDATAVMFGVDHLTSSPELTFKRRDDPRVASGFAAFCRRHSIDELPQLWHVVSGVMSLVGPRPLTASELERHYGAAAEEVLAVKPGLTGLWQVQGRSQLTMPERVALDIELVRSTSGWTKLRIMLRTILAVFSGKGAW